MLNSVREMLQPGALFAPSNHRSGKETSSGNAALEKIIFSASMPSASFATIVV